jgi:transcriptional regulator with XRE-family HTH domain
MRDARSIRALRKRKALTQAEVADAAGINPATLYRIEMGLVDPSARSRRGIARALGIPVEELFVVHDAPNATAIGGVRGHGVGEGSDQGALAASAKS